MNDLDLIRELRAEVAVPATHLAGGRDRLLAAIARDQRRGARSPARARRPAVMVPAAAAAVAAVALVAGYGIAGAGHPAAGKAGTAAPGQATLAARTLLTAAAAAQRAPVVTEPGPDQWIYARTVRYEYKRGTTSAENWTTFDGSTTAYSQGGRLVVHTMPGGPGVSTGGALAAFNADMTPRTAYRALASLPLNPAALLAAAGRAAMAIGPANLAAGTPLASQAPRTQGQLEFDYLALLLWNAAGGVGGPPGAEAAVFRAMSILPGVTIQADITDAAGAPATGISADRADQLLLDPASYQVIGLRQLSTGTAPRPAAAGRRGASLPAAARQNLTSRALWPRAGTVIFSLAYAQVSEVTGPGVR